jgi:NIMA (never in mitosis gene a)-related kinase
MLYRNENIIGYKEAFFEEATNTLCVIMEFADNGDLQGKMEELKKSNTYMSEEEIWGITLKLITALFVLHNMKIVHRDIKCANVFLCKDG